MSSKFSAIIHVILCCVLCVLIFYPGFKRRVSDPRNRKRIMKEYFKKSFRSYRIIRHSYTDIEYELYHIKNETSPYTIFLANDSKNTNMKLDVVRDAYNYASVIICRMTNRKSLDVRNSEISSSILAGIHYLCPDMSKLSIRAYGDGYSQVFRMMDRSYSVTTICIIGDSHIWPIFFNDGADIVIHKYKRPGSIGMKLHSVVFVDPAIIEAIYSPKFTHQYEAFRAPNFIDFVTFLHKDTRMVMVNASPKIKSHSESFRNAIESFFPDRLETFRMKYADHQAVMASDYILFMGELYS